MDEGRKKGRQKKKKSNLKEDSKKSEY